MALCSCSAVERTVYLQDIEDNKEVNVALEQQIRIKAFDRLIVVVSSKDSELAAPFNVMTSYNSLSNSTIGQTTVSSSQGLQVRTVDKDGNLYMPIIGNIACAGKSRSEVAEIITRRITERGYIADAAVNSQFADMRLFVLGEVARPGQFDITRDQITILEVLAMAGDMTIYGDRSNVKIIRENADGEKIIAELDLKDANIISSPFYQLQQNDIVYVTPNKVKAKNSGIGSETSLWFTSTSILISLASLLYNILR
jgi:polysaccharide export outer membrane protein